MDRRALLSTVGATTCGAFLTSCAARLSPLAVPSPARRRIAPVEMSRDRVIRTIVGLRPYRPGGFVVRTDVIDGKPVIHNYGHGGAGITLCWGSAHLAMEEALRVEHRQCAVLGCGVVGLTTAIVLQRRGFQVTIYARDLPPQTTSNVAGGLWLPTSVYEESAASAAFKAQFLRAARLSYQYFQELVGAPYGVRWIQNYLATNDPISRPRWFPDLIDLFPELEELAPGQHPFPRRYVSRNACLQIQPPVFLPAIERDFRLAGGHIVVQAFRSLRDVLALAQPLVINCTGLGARDLFSDTELVPVKGQLTVLLPQPEVDYILGVDNVALYMHPRADGVLLGGTFERGVSSLEPNDTESRRILNGHEEFFSAMRRLGAA
jgi:D-amino-acid oxidase